SQKDPRAESRCGQYASHGTAGAAQVGETAGGASGAFSNGGAGGTGSGEPGPTPPPPIKTPATPGGSIISDEYVGDVSLELHTRINTVLVATWTQTKAAEATWLEFGIAGEDPMQSRARSGSAGIRSEVVLGVPAQREVTLRVVSKHGDIAYKSSEFKARTKALPKGMPEPRILAYDAGLASSEPWLFGSVEDSEGGGPHGYYSRTFWLYIMDRRGRIVWYWADPASNATT